VTHSFALEAAVGLSMQVLVVVAATAAIEGRLGGAREACRLWTTCFLALLGLIAAALLLPHLRLLTFPTFGSGETVLTIVSWQERIARLGLLVWLVGVGLCLLRSAVRSARLLRFLSKQCRVLSALEVAKLPLPKTSFPVEFRILVSDQIAGPFCWQLHRPTIILPRYMLAEDATILRHVLLHEAEHLRTNHALQLLFQQMCVTLLWFHPAVWWAGRRAEMAREYLCDEVAARSDGQFASYLRTLASVAERCAGSPACVLAFGRRKSSIVRRTERLVGLANDHTDTAPRLRPPLAWTLMLIALLTSQLWLPVNARASARSRLSPWPQWTAHVLHDVGISVRDFEVFDERHDLRQS
jgi:beta-lactamase regulating signal transducer with metallopeptidase domain